jgi:hypothetical protein
MAKPDLTEVYDALRAAEANQNKEDVAKLIGYIQSVENEPEGKTYDPRDQVPRAIAAGVGAPAGVIASGLAAAGVNKVQQARGKFPEMTAVHPDELVKKHTLYNPTGRSVEESIANWENYNQAQLEKAKKIRQESALHKKYPGFSRAPAVPEIPPLPENATIAQKVGHKIWPGATQDIGHFLQGVSEYRLPFIGKVGPLAGHLFGGAATFSQAADAYNRSLQDDPTGTLISGIGAVGTGVATLPFPPPVRAVGAGVGLSAEAINAYRDAIARGQIEHGAPQSYEQTTPMGDQYAHGGLVYLTFNK